MSRLKVDTIQDRSGNGVALDASLKLKQLTETQIDALSGMGEGEMVYDTTNKNIRVYNGTTSEWEIVNPVTSKSVTGGNITTSGSYTIHTFNSSDNFAVTGFPGASPLAVEYLVIAGGGGGGDGNLIAGAGAGGYRSNVAGQSSGGGASAESA